MIQNNNSIVKRERALLEERNKLKKDLDSIQKAHSASSRIKEEIEKEKIKLNIEDDYSLRFNSYKEAQEFEKKVENRENSLLP